MRATGLKAVDQSKQLAKFRGLPDAEQPVRHADEIALCRELQHILPTEREAQWSDFVEQAVFIK